MSINRKTDVIQVRRGVSLYKVPRSPYWQARVYSHAKGGYIVRSTKETARTQARIAAEELIASLARAGEFESKPRLDKEFSFEFFAQRVLKAGRMTNRKYAGRDDARILNREGDGLIAYFGADDIRTITTSDIRDYFHDLQESRTKPLSESTLSKHVIVLRKVFNEAIEFGSLQTMPSLPKQTATPNPRTSFTDAEFDKLLEATRRLIQARAQVKGRLINEEMLNLIQFMVGSFVRPLATELFAIRHRDVAAAVRPKSLQINIVAGKTGARTAVSMPECVDVYAAQVSLVQGIKPSDYVFFSAIASRTKAVTVARQMFNFILEEAGLKFDAEGKPRVLYSLRHYAIQRRLAESGGDVNIYTLAKNAGTSVEIIEKYYAKFMPLSEALIENLQVKKITPSGRS